MLKEGTLVPLSISIDVFVALSTVPALFQFFNCKPPSSMLVLLPILYLSLLPEKSVPQGISIRDFLMCAFCGDLFSKIDQISDQFLGHDKCFLDFWMCGNLTFKRLFSSIVSIITRMQPEPRVLLFPDA